MTGWYIPAVEIKCTSEADALFPLVGVEHAHSSTTRRQPHATSNSSSSQNVHHKRPSLLHPGSDDAIDNLGQIYQDDLSAFNVTAATSSGEPHAHSTHRSSIPMESPDMFNISSDYHSASFGTVPAAGTSNANNNTSGSGSWAGTLVWSDWPQDLPGPEVVEHIVGVFFDKIPTLGKMIHRATFMSSLQLPPSHSRFPVSLI